MKRNLATFAALLAFVAVSTWVQWDSRRAQRTPIAQVDLETTIQWTVEPTLFWYRHFQVTIRGNESGAKWTASLDEGFTTEGAFTKEEWSHFLDGFRGVHGNDWHLWATTGPLASDQANFTLSVEHGGTRTEASVYGLPSNQHAAVAQFFDGKLVSRIMADFRAQNDAAIKGQ